MNETLTYEQAYEELAEIAEALESETISVDELAEKVKRASYLVTLCKSKLQSTEAEVNHIINQMEQNSK
ncbi:exodeoxyribonuclease VII small subunit [Mucilaginibacter sp. Bleaf8]|uniref:exodeoxyribonuclease VII small subunit n=1 Tax=Mucilaginibacter sp. Bleaf8 TaxID=2834430 RepID=UPI001BCE3542|nr:exodeoxyribonuclease VII small subunit [Mucilaginibacter sp. Bleaf8]MBS7563207.1 exodeoxyribonuclease VII small subunit [Mucilaginibacter sp. Bleaf8]